MAKITQVPTSVSNAGQNAEYPGNEVLATVTLVSCPLDPAYEWVASSRNTVNTYISSEVSAGRGWQNSEVHSFTHEGLELPIPFHVASLYNYMKVEQGGYTWYYFATPEPVTAGSTMWSLVTDAWTTYMPTVRGTLLRGHYGIKMALSDTSILSETEPIDTGELQTLAQGSYDIFGSGYDVWTLSSVNVDGVGFRDLRSDLRGQDTPINMINETAQLGQGGDPFQAVTTVTSGHVPGGGWPLSFLETGANYNIGFPLTPDPVEIPWESRVPRTPSGASSLYEYRPMPGGVHVLSKLGWKARVESMSHAPWMLDGIVGTNAVPANSFPSVGGGGASRSNFEYNADNSSNSRFPVQSSLLGWDISNAARGATYIRTGTRVLISGWRSYLDDGSAINKKLSSPQFAAVVFGDLSGQERMYSPDSVGSTSLTVAWSRTLGLRSEYSFWPNDIAGESVRPFSISWSVGFGYTREGFGQAFGPQAVAFHTDRRLSEAKYISDIRQQAYARYSSQAKEGAFNTIINRTLAGWGGLI